MNAEEVRGLMKCKRTAHDRVKPLLSNWLNKQRHEGSEPPPMVEVLMAAYMLGLHDAADAALPTEQAARSHDAACDEAHRHRWPYCCAESCWCKSDPAMIADAERVRARDVEAWRKAPTAPNGEGGE